MTLAVICETLSSTNNELGQQIDPAANTAPRLGVSKIVICAPPLSAFFPCANSFMPGGDDGEILSVSWPEAPPGIRKC